MTVKSIPGFEDPEEYHTSSPTVLAMNLVSLAVLTEFFFPGVVAEFRAAVPYSAAEFLQFLSANWSQIIGFVLFSVTIVIIHELIHVVTHKWNGFDHSYGIRWVWLWKLPNPAPYVVVFDELLTRSENIMGLLAPFVVLTAVGLIGLLSLSPAIMTYYAKVLLVVNTAGSAGDIYNSVKVARFPPGTLFRNIESEDEIRTFTYEPSR